VSNVREEACTAFAIGMQAGWTLCGPENVTSDIPLTEKAILLTQL
jgi:hypothetical protein